MSVHDPIVVKRAQPLREVVRGAARALAAAGVETPERDARLLAGAATGFEAAELIARPDRPVDEGARSRLAELVRRRCAREPVSRILGAREFFGRSFALSPATLDPRPDSETLIETALAFVDENGWRTKPLRILDVGTGTGCLLVTLLAELAHASGLGTDVNEEALEVATANARRHGVAERAQFLRRSGLEGVDGPFDLLVCNPPYIASREIAGLAPEVRDFDPPGALDGGPDGLHLFREMIPGLTRVIPCGYVVFEVGAGQADCVAQMLQTIEGARQETIRRRKDLGGHSRCVAMEIQL
jgi:release factor glutamine methyltransferase